MQTGIVTRWIRTYGFITPDDGSDDLFTHVAYTGGQPLTEGAKVSFHVATDLKTHRPLASEVKVLD